MREKLIKLLKSNPYANTPYSTADHLIANDVVQVVRCKDCKYYTHGNQSAHWNEKALACFRKARLSVKPDDFCSFGERRDGE